MNVLDVSTQNPILFRNSIAPNAYHTHWFDLYPFPETIKSYEEKMKYLAPFERRDVLCVQIMSNFQPHNFSILDSWGVTVLSTNMTYTPASVELTGQRVYEVRIPLTALPEGAYKCIISSGSPALFILESEPFCLKDRHENSVALQYSNSENDFGIAYETGVVFTHRLRGWVTDYQPGNDRTVFIDQKRKIVQLDGSSYNLWMLFCGSEFGIPDWIARLINKIFLADTVRVDGRRMVASDGVQMEATREEGWPLTGWAFQLREAANDDTVRYETDSGDSEIVTTVVNNVEVATFGTITTGGAQLNQIQIIDNGNY